MRNGDVQLGPGGHDLSPLDLSGVDFAALQGDAEIEAMARTLVRAQLIRTGEAAAWLAWERFRSRLMRLPPLKGTVLRPDRAECEALGLMREAGTAFERDVGGDERRALEARAMRELRRQVGRRSAG